MSLKEKNFLTSLLTLRVRSKTLNFIREKLTVVISN